MEEENLLNNETMRYIAERHGITASQVLNHCLDEKSEDKILEGNEIEIVSGLIKQYDSANRHNKPNNNPKK